MKFLVERFLIYSLEEFNPKQESEQKSKHRTRFRAKQQKFWSLNTGFTCAKWFRQRDDRLAGRNKNFYQIIPSPEASFRERKKHEGI